VEARLLYDTAGGDEKQVDFVKSSPMEYACKINPKGDSVTVDMKLAVLSSQHEDMFFRVKFSVKATSLSVISDPIKVVSKPAQLKKNRDSMRRGTKRTFNDTLKESLARIEAAQRDQQSMIGSLLQTFAIHSLPTSALPQPKSSQPPLKKTKLGESKPQLISFPSLTVSTTVPTSKAELFEAHLLGLIAAYHDIPMEERAETVRKVVRGSSAVTTDQLSEVVDCLLLEGLKREIGTNVETGSPYAGLMDFGNHEQGTADLDSFCSEFLAPLIGPEEEPTSNPSLSRWFRRVTSNHRRLCEATKESDGSGRRSDCESPTKTNSGRVCNEPLNMLLLATHVYRSPTLQKLFFVT
jgi:hypothetical protein